jgi:hypothetical protein
MPLIVHKESLLYTRKQTSINFSVTLIMTYLQLQALTDKYLTGARNNNIHNH